MARRHQTQDKWFSMRTDFFGADAYQLGMYQLSGRAIGVYIAGCAYASKWGLDYCFRNHVVEVLGPNCRPGPVVAALVDFKFWLPAADSRNKFYIAHEGILWRRGTPVGRRSIPESVRLEVMERDGRRCQECGTDHHLTLDHIWPYSKGGTDDAKNLRVLCRSCNSSKGARV